jgi:hypothetical protein
MVSCSSRTQIPALVLDCNEDVDVEHDVQYREHVATKVKKYTDYVKEFMKAKANVPFSQV